MKTTWELQDDIFEWFANDAQLLALLGNPTTDDELNSKIRREIGSMDDVQDGLDFIVVYFLPGGGKSNNWLANRGSLIIDYFCTLRANAQQLAQRANAIVKSNTGGEVNMATEGQVTSGITGVFQYRQRYMPLVRG